VPGRKAESARSRHWQCQDERPKRLGVVIGMERVKARKSEMIGDYYKRPMSSAGMKGDIGNPVSRLAVDSDVIDSCSIGRLWKMKVSERRKESGRSG
jgi:hypothetical protein